MKPVVPRPSNNVVDRTMTTEITSDPNDIMLSDYRKRLLGRLEKVTVEFRRTVLLLIILSMTFVLAFLVPYVELRFLRAENLREVLDETRGYLQKIETFQTRGTKLRLDSRKSRDELAAIQREQRVLAALEQSGAGLEFLASQVEHDFSVPLDVLTLDGIDPSLIGEEPWLIAPWGSALKSHRSEVMAHYLVMQSVRSRIMHHRSVLKDRVIAPLENLEDDVSEEVMLSSRHIVSHIDMSVRSTFRSGLQENLASTPGAGIWQAWDSLEGSDQIILDIDFRNELMNESRKLFALLDNAIHKPKTRIPSNVKKRLSEVEPSVHATASSQRGSEQDEVPRLQETRALALRLEIAADRARRAARDAELRHAEFTRAGTLIEAEQESFRERLTAIRERLDKRQGDLEVQFDSAVSFLKLKLDLDLAVLIFPLLSGGAFLLCCTQFAEGVRLRRALLPQTTNPERQRSLDSLRLISPMPLADQQRKLLQTVPVVIAILVQVAALWAVLFFQPDEIDALDRERVIVHEHISESIERLGSVDKTEPETLRSVEEVQTMAEIKDALDEMDKGLKTESYNPASSTNRLYFLSFAVGMTGMIWGIRYVIASREGHSNARDR